MSIGDLKVTWTCDLCSDTVETKSDNHLPSKWNRVIIKRMCRASYSKITSKEEYIHDESFDLCEKCYPSELVIRSISAPDWMSSAKMAKMPLLVRLFSFIRRDKTKDN